VRAKSEKKTKNIHVLRKKRKKPQEITGAEQKEASMAKSE